MFAYLCFVRQVLKDLRVLDHFALAFAFILLTTGALPIWSLVGNLYSRDLLPEYISDYEDLRMRNNDERTDRVSLGASTATSCVPSGGFAGTSLTSGVAIGSLMLNEPAETE